jgi:single-strand selective monofunctional uracil DNA glycosylase
MTTAQRLKDAARDLSRNVSDLKFSSPVAVVYNPLEYAWKSYALYLERYANSMKRVVFLGMNPGPWGMAQTGVPFGEVDAVKGWLGIESEIAKPALEHPMRPVEGFQCTRSEVSGRRLWGFFKERFGLAEHFFKDHFVANYCPLVFMEESGRNRTPDKLKPEERQALFTACDLHLRRATEILQPEWLIGVGRFTEKRALDALKEMNIRIATILHPSPASPAANRDWAGTVDRQLSEVWSEKARSS